MKDGIRIYYASSNGYHRYWRDGFLCLATLRPDGWAGYEPLDLDQTGIVVTHPLTWKGKLQITADLEGGSIQVSIIDTNGNILEVGQHFEEDVSDHELAPANPEQLARLAGQMICLRFALNRSKLYSFVLTE
jgi:hypothetical protein|tara:strand:- start:321 stop:716 length:396 start_codon:yes stop_codon:yes gene_type:complete